MKGLIIFGVVALGAMLATFYFMGKGMDDDGDIPFGMAVGKPSNGEAELLVVVAFGMTRAQGPKLSNGVEQWDKWVAEHFDLRDSTGKKLDMQRSMHGNSSLITDKQAITPEFFLRALLKPGAYTLDYIPVLEEKKRFRHKFTIGPEGIPFERPSLKQVEK